MVVAAPRVQVDFEGCVYITHPNHGAGARPSQEQAPTATRLAKPNDDQCVHRPREGRGRNRQTPPPQKKMGNKQRAETRKKGGGQEADTQPQSHAATPQEEGKPPGQATPKATFTTGSPERTPEDRPAKPGDTQQRAAPPGRKEHPGYAGTHPTSEVAGRKKTHGCSRNDRRRGDGDQETQDRDTQRRTPQRHDTTGPKTASPPQPEKKNKRGGGGANPTHVNPSHNPTPQGAPPEEGRKQTRRTQEATRPNTEPRKNRSAGKTQTQTHTHHVPQPGKAECDQNPCPDTHTLDPSQQWRGYR